MSDVHDYVIQLLFKGMYIVILLTDWLTDSLPKLTMMHC